MPESKPHSRALAAARAAGVIATKDLRQQLRSGTLLLFALVLPLGLAFMFTNLLGGAADRFTATYAVVDEDQGPLARAFVDDVLGSVSEATGGDIEIRAAGSVAEATTLLESDEISAAYVIPEGFTADVEAGRAATLRVIGNVDAAIGTQVARGIAEAYATDLGSVRLAVAVASAAAPDADPQQLAEQARQLPQPVTLRQGAATADRELEPGTYYAAGMAVFFLFFTAMLTVTSILEERSGGTMARLLATPTPRTAILLGKLAAGVAVGVVAMAVLVAASTLLLGADWGDLRGVVPLLVAVVLAATGLMAVIASFAGTAEQASNWMSAVAVVLGLFGGSFVPLAQLGVLGPVSYLTPHRWFLQGLSDLAGAGPGAVVGPVLALLVFAAAGLAVALVRVGAVIRA